MGDVIIGICGCGFEVPDIYLGVGMMGGAADAICYCDDCENVQSVVEYESPKICDKCKNHLKPYITLLEDYDEKEIDFAGGDDDSEGTYYHCPKCKNKSLKFHYAGIWD
tara:strand:+ start:147 stop:473 length:327 start_codon:yes stop_codon:yes gene_type:complete